MAKRTSAKDLTTPASIKHGPVLATLMDDHMDLPISYLEGEALDAAIHEAERRAGRSTANVARPSDREQQMDLIIDRERISTLYYPHFAKWAGGFEMESIDDTKVGRCFSLSGQQFGPTRRIAAMRAYVYRALVADSRTNGI